MNHYLKINAMCNHHAPGPDGTVARSDARAFDSDRMCIGDESNDHAEKQHVLLLQYAR